MSGLQNLNPHTGKSGTVSNLNPIVITGHG